MKEAPTFKAVSIIPLHLDWTSFLVPVVLIALRYVWKGLLWFILPGIDRAVASGIRRAMQPELDRINQRLDQLEHPVVVVTLPPATP